MNVIDFFKNPYVITFLAYTLAYSLHFHVISPFEHLYDNVLTGLASWLFLPHAVRVLSVWMLGPKALIGLLPAHYLIGYIMYPERSLFDLDMLAPLVASMSAVMAFEVFKLANLNLYLDDLQKALHWRTLLLVGAVASVFNAVGLTFVYQDHIDQASMYTLMTKYLVGDTLGLFLGLVLVVLVLRWVLPRPSATSL